MADIVVKRGLDIPIKGRAAGEPVDLDPPDTVAWSPTEFRGLAPRLDVKEGEEVKAGQPLVRHKDRPNLKLVSPVAGVVKEIRRGPRRVLTDVVIERRDGEAITHDAPKLDGLTREQAIELLLVGGLWPTLRTRPLDKMADPGVTPQSILIAGYETGPLLPGAAVLLSADDKDAMQAGVKVLQALAPKVWLTTGPGTHAALSGLSGVETRSFEGPHPAGDPAVQINLVDPPRGGAQVWYIRAWDVADIGRLFLTGQFPAQRVYAAIGAGAKTPRYVRTLLGAPLRHIVGDTHEGDHRWIRGSVLTGERVDAERWASFYHRAVHVLPDTVHRQLFAWALPDLGSFSWHRSFVAGFGSPSRDYDLRPALRGGLRAMVPLGIYGDVVATPDVLPEFLFKSIIVGDLEESIQLGMLDISMEEAALCTYICPSKMEFDVILREGLALYEREA